MSGLPSPLALATADAHGTAVDQPDRELQALWFAIAGGRSRTVALVPGDEGLSAAVLASELADVGTRLLGYSVTAMVVQPADLANPHRLAGFVSAARPQAAPAKAGLSVIFAVPPVTVEPLGLAVVQAADAAVLCVERNRSTMRGVGRAVARIGRERIAGCILIN